MWYTYINILKKEAKLPEQYLSVEEARKMLNVTKMKISAWIAQGILHATEDIFDRRRKLIKRSEVEALMATPGFRKMAEEQATNQDATSVLGAGQLGLS
jgi:excisionase family DNA binding protein